MTMVNLSLGEVALVVEALEYRASRHESYSRINPRGAGPHDRKAEAMHELAAKLKSVPTPKRGDT